MAKFVMKFIECYFVFLLIVAVFDRFTIVEVAIEQLTE